MSIENDLGRDCGLNRRRMKTEIRNYKAMKSAEIMIEEET